MVLIFLILALTSSAVAQRGQFGRKLTCDRLYGNFVTCCDLNNLEFGKPMEPGDKLTINGTQGSTTGYFYTQIRIRDSTGRIIPLNMRGVDPIDVPLDFSKACYTADIGGGWGVLEYGPTPFFINAQLQISVEYTSSAFLIYSGNTLIKTFYNRHQPSTVLLYLELRGDYVTNWVQMDCARDRLSTVAPSTSKRPRKKHGHGKGHHGNHGKFGSSSSSSSSSSSQEFCD